MKTEYKGYYVQLGSNLAYHRRARRVTQVRLAELVGVDRSHISAIEIGTVGISLDLIFKICDVLDIAPALLFDFAE